MSTWRYHSSAVLLDPSPQKWPVNRAAECMCVMQAEDAAARSLISQEQGRRHLEAAREAAQRQVEIELTRKQVGVKRTLCRRSI